MKPKSVRFLPPELPDDGPEMQEAVKAVSGLGIPFRRTSLHQLKSGNVNFWPSTGKITVDREGVFAGHGLAMFLERIQELH